MERYIFKYKINAVSLSDFELKTNHFLLLYSDLATKIKSNLNEDPHKILPFSTVYGVSRLFKPIRGKYKKRVYKNEKLYFYVMSTTNIEDILYNPINIRNIKLTITSINIKKYNIEEMLNQNYKEKFVRLGSLLFPIQFDIDKFVFGPSEIVFRFSVFLHKFLDFPKVIVLNKQLRKKLDYSTKSYFLRFIYYNNKYKWFLGYFEVPTKVLKNAPILFNACVFLSNIFSNNI